MFKKILIVEDFETYHLGIKDGLESLGIREIVTETYCQKAYDKIKKDLNSSPFQLLITDLSFLETPEEHEIKDGIQLIKKIKEEKIPIKTLVITFDQKIHTLRECQNLDVDGFVNKGREDMKEIKKALTEISVHRKYLSQTNLHRLRCEDFIELNSLELAIVELLSQGYKQKDLSPILMEKNIYPNSLSKIEKTMAHLREKLNVNNTEQLLLKLKEQCII